MTRKDFQPSVLHPKGAGKLEELPAALERWETNMRKFRQAQGTCPSDHQKRFILVDMLPSDMAPYITPCNWAYTPATKHCRSTFCSIVR